MTRACRHGGLLLDARGVCWSDVWTMRTLEPGRQTILRLGVAVFGSVDCVVVVGAAAATGAGAGSCADVVVVIGFCFTLVTSNSVSGCTGIVSTMQSCKSAPSPPLSMKSSSPLSLDGGGVTFAMFSDKHV